MKNETFSSCCGASPRGEINGVEYNDDDYGICAECHDHCTYIDPDDLCETCGYEECQCVTYEDGSKDPVDDDGLIRPAFKPTSDDAIAFAGTAIMLLAMLGLIAILQ